MVVVYPYRLVTSVHPNFEWTLMLIVYACDLSSASCATMVLVLIFMFGIVNI